MYYMFTKLINIVCLILLCGKLNAGDNLPHLTLIPPGMITDKVNLDIRAVLKIFQAKMNGGRWNYILIRSLRRQYCIIRNTLYCPIVRWK